MSDFNPDNFKIGPCVVTYKGAQLGATSGGIKLNVNMDTVDIKCDQSYGQPVKRVVTAIKLSVTMTMLEVDSNLSLLLSDGKITSAVIGTNLLANGGVLLLTPVDTTDKVSYQFPNAVLEPQADYAISSSAADTVQLKFTAWPDSSGVFLSKVS